MEYTSRAEDFKNEINKLFAYDLYGSYVNCLQCGHHLSEAEEESLCYQTPSAGNVDWRMAVELEVIDDVLEHGDFYIALRGMTLFHNEGDGTFTNVTYLLGDTSGAKVAGDVGVVYGAGFQPAWVDYDNDGDSDLYVVNDIGRQIQPNVLWRNDGVGPDGRYLY